MATKSKSERFELRIDEELFERVDKWAGEQPDYPTRAEAVRRLVSLGLSTGSNHAVRFSDGEKMLILMMSDLYKALKIKGADSNPGFLAEVIYGGHYWAPKWDMNGVFHDHVDDPDEVNYVVDVLDMWSFIEEAYESLSPADKSTLETALGSTITVSFPGFDGNDESSQLGIAQFLIEKMGRFTRFDPRNLNSHSNTAYRYRAMLDVFEPIRKTLIGTKLNVSQLVSLLKA